MNQTGFICRLTQDPEPTTPVGDTEVTTLRVAIQRRPGRDNVDRGAAFYDLEVWGGLAETCATYLAKGRRIAVEGRLEHREWTDENGRHERNYIVGEDIQFLDAPPQESRRAEAEPAPESLPAAA